MNIIYLVSDLRPAGPTNQAYNLMTGLKKLNCNPILVTLFEEPRDSWIDRFLNENITIRQLHLDRRHLREAAKRLETIINDEDVSIVHSSGLSADSVNRYVKSFIFKITTIRQEFHVIGEKHNKIVQFVSRLITRKNYKAMDVRVACSNILAEDVQNATGLSIEAVENGVDVDRFVPADNSQKEQLRMELGLPAGKKIYISTGVFYPRKQMVELTKAFLSLQNSGSVLLLVGDGQTYDEVKSIAAGKDNIILIGKKEDPKPYYQASDIFISTSLAEGLPNTVIEAMACGLPCILSDIGPHKEILGYNQSAGCMFKTLDYDEFKLCIQESFNWEINRKRDAALDIIKSHLSKYVMAENYYNIYKKMLENE